MKIEYSDLLLKIAQAYGRAETCNEGQQLALNEQGTLDMINMSRSIPIDRKLILTVYPPCGAAMPKDMADTMANQLINNTNFKPGDIFRLAYALGYHASDAPQKRLIKRLENTLLDVLKTVRPVEDLTVDELDPEGEHFGS